VTLVNKQTVVEGVVAGSTLLLAFQGSIL